MPSAPARRHLLRRLDHFVRVVAAGAGEHRNLALRLLDDDLDDAQALGGGERRRLAGRAAGHEKVNAGVDLPPCQPPHARLVQRAAPA